MVAGEASGDLLAGLLLDGIKVQWPGFTAAGIGGPQMVRRGFQAWWPHSKLSVHGYGWEVLRRYREIVGIRRQLKERLLKSPPAVFVGVDAPDFNLDLERDLKAAGVKTIHFVSPSIWAWRADRVVKIRASVDHVLCIFPFEPALLASHGIASTYVGHPLASVIPMQSDPMDARAKLGLGPQDVVLAILPGSRESEVKFLAQRFFEAAALIAKAYPATKFIVPAIPTLRLKIETAVRLAGMEGRVVVVEGQSHTVLAACDATLIASGTATLEAALFKKPMVIAYRMGWLSWLIMRRKKLQPWVGLPNILCKEFVVPEFLQGHATASALAKSTIGWLYPTHTESERLHTLQSKFNVLHRDLQRDTSELAARAIRQVLES
jgi:lipid-A-disaccharide synthase